MIYKIQADLMEKFPQLRQKSYLIPFYISLQHPEKQRKIVSWWAAMIDTAIRHSKSVFVSPSDLQSIFTMHGLKPIPLPTVLQIIAKSDKFQWRDKKTVQTIKKQETNSWISSILSAIIPQKKVSARLSRPFGLNIDTQSKIISKGYLNQQLQKTKRVIEIELQAQSNISYQYITMQAKKDTSLNHRSIQFLIQELGNKGWIRIQSIDNKKVIVYSNDASDLSNPQWVKKQKSKFKLKFAINGLKNKVEQKVQQQSSKMESAKGIVEKDKKKAKQYLLQARNIQKIRQQLQTRIRALQNSLTSLQLNQVDGKALSALEGVNQIIKNSTIDASVFDNIRQTNEQFKMNQKQINMNFDQLNNINKDDDQDQDVDNLMKELQRDIAGKKKKMANSQKQDSNRKFTKNQTNYMGDIQKTFNYM